MKVRWTEASLRLRLTPSEMTLVERRLPVEAALALAPEGGWRVVLAAADGPTTLTQEGNLLRIALGPVDLVRLLAPDAEGVYFHAGSADGIRFYVEKDFPCAHPRGAEALEPPTETFLPPRDFEERKTGAAADINNSLGSEDREQ